MTPFQSTSMFLLLAASPLSASAVTVFQCEDQNGERTFQDRCPPGTTPVMETRYGAPTPAATAATAATGSAEPALIYVVPNCETCDQVREYLQFRGVAFTEVNVADDVELQNQLKEQAGQLRVPATVIGGQSVVGYNRGALSSALAAAGYAVADEAEAGEEENTGTADEELSEEEFAAEEEFVSGE